MHDKIHRMAKTKVSVTIESSVLERIDRLAESASRSEIFERALQDFLVARRKRQLENEVATYYANRLQEEMDEDRAWAELSASDLEKTWR